MTAGARGSASESSRGEFRPIYKALLDGPDYQRLGSDSRLVLLTLKLTLDAPGIGVVRRGTLEEQTGLSAKRTRIALETLEHAGWIRRELNVVWLLNGLRYEPSLSPNDSKHRLHVRRKVLDLPHIALLEEYRKAYPEWFEDHASAPDLGELTKALPSSPGGASMPLCGSGSGSGSGSSSHTTGNSRRRTATEEPAGFADAWSAYPRRTGGNPRPAALRAYRARLREGVTPAALRAGVERYNRYCVATGKVGTEYVKMASSFFGRDAHYAEPWEARDSRTESDLDALAAWLAPASQAWERRNGAGSFPFGKAAAALSALHKAGIEPAEIGIRLGNYLDAKRGRGDTFVTVGDFAKHHQQYSGPYQVDGALTELGEAVTRPVRVST